MDGTYLNKRTMQLFIILCPLPVQSIYTYRHHVCLLAPLQYCVKPIEYIR